MVSTIIVAAGSSRRMGFDKMFTLLAGKPVVAHSIKAFEDTREIDEIIIVAKTERVAEFEDLIRSARFKKVKAIVAGGSERHNSVWNGLQAIQGAGSELVVVHDGARPLTTPKLIRECLQAAKEHGAACCASPIPDTVKRATMEQMVQESVEPDTAGFRERLDPPGLRRTDGPQ
jgi:2-C-methyl-D-erythritol 4-phosphate cytidylyltransferase